MLAAQQGLGQALGSQAGTSEGSGLEAVRGTRRQVHRQQLRPSASSAEEGVTQWFPLHAHGRLPGIWGARGRLASGETSPRQGTRAAEGFSTGMTSPVLC